MKYFMFLVASMVACVAFAKAVPEASENKAAPERQEAMATLKPNPQGIADCTATKCAGKVGAELFQCKKDCYRFNGAENQVPPFENRYRQCMDSHSDDEYCAGVAVRFSQKMSDEKLAADLPARCFQMAYADAIKDTKCTGRVPTGHDMISRTKSMQ